ncbi:hypothetical protein [Photobacterium sp. Hal280]|uniref:hypothetical protein n=1 Tax=Photobacterium sp. Hal280 TaxID=3035163 RepID=UPI00301CBB5C
MFRKEAKISSLSFSILNKEVDLKSNSAETQVQLAYAQMCRSEKESRFIRELSLSLEEAIAKSTHTLLEKLWTLDYPYLHQMHACTTTENVPFSDHLLSIFSTKLQYSMECDEGLNLQISNLEKHLNEYTEKHCSFSKESPNAMHDFEASTYFLGKAVDDIEFNNEILHFLSETPSKIPYKIPFGLLLRKGITLGLDDCFSEGDEVLLNCTQQCDLSRNIIKQGINLIFIQGSLSSGPSNKHYSIPLPTDLDKEKRRWWINVDEKKIVAKPFFELLRYLILGKYAPVAIARESVVRQVRTLAFHNMSRTEASVKSGHNNLFTVELITYGQDNAIKYLDVQGQAKQVLLYGFPDGGSDKSYHLLDQEHVEVITWLLTNSTYVKDKISQECLEHVLKNELPKINKKSKLISGVKFAVQTCESKLENLVSQQYPVTILFTMV